MPELNRRLFLQVASAAGLAPALPASAAPITHHTSAQMMWANLYAQAGNARSAAGLASALNVPLDTAKSLFAGISRTSSIAARATTVRPARPSGKTLEQVRDIARHLTQDVPEPEIEEPVDA